MKVQLDDVIKIPHEVEIPDTCPGCGTDLIEAGLKHFEYQDQSRCVDVKLNDVGTRIIEWDTALPKSCDSYLAVVWQCGSCGHPLAESNEAALAGEADKDLIEAIYTKYQWLPHIWAPVDERDLMIAVRDWARCKSRTDSEESKALHQKVEDAIQAIRDRKAKVDATSSSVTTTP